MVGSGGQLSRGAIVVAIVVVGAGLRPAAVAAVEDSTQVLPGVTVNAQTVDLDGDGDREIVRLTQEGAGPDHDGDAWGYDGKGWSMIG